MGSDPTIALEQPARPSMLPSFIDGMALLVFDPANFVFRKESKVGGLYEKTRWVELPRRDDRFDAFLSGVSAFLASDVLPLPEGACSICRLRFYPRGNIEDLRTSTESPSVIRGRPIR